MSAKTNIINMGSGDSPALHAHAETVGQLVPRDGNPQGVYSDLFRGQLRNAILPGLYETLREAIPLLDAAIDIYVMLDGVPTIVGENTEAVHELNRFAREVQVGDNQHGLPAYTHAKRDEVHEQGFAISEHLIGDNGIFRLNVADSKAIHFARKKDGSLGWYYDPLQQAQMPFDPDNTEKVAQILQHRTPINIRASFFDNKSFIELDRERSHYLAFRTENSDAYGVSLLRSLPFFAEILLTIANSIKNTWERFGDPNYHLHYKAAGRLGEQLDANGDTPLEARRKVLSSGLSATVKANRAGGSADFVTAVDKDSEITISVIGADGQVLDASVPMTKIIEQLAAKLKLPAWMLGIDAGSVQGQAKFQSEVVQQASATRTDLESMELDRICAIHLRANGITWSDDLVDVDDPYSPSSTRKVRAAWRIEYRKPNLSDIVAKAQANFMNTQSEVLKDRTGSQDLNTSTPTSITSENADGTKTTTTHNLANSELRMKNVERESKSGCVHHSKFTIQNLETRPIPNPALDIVETDAVKGVSDLWTQTTEHVVSVLGLPDLSNGMASDGFTFTQKDKAAISEALAEFTAESFATDGGDLGAMELAYLRAWSQGVIDAYTASSLAAPIGELTNDAAVASLRGEAMGTFATNIDKKFAPKLWRILEAGTSSGDNPLEIARKLRSEFGGFAWKWEQIARSEVAIAHDAARRGEWLSEINDGAIDDQFDWIPAPDACPICMAMVHGFNGNKAPYTIDNMPRLVLDTHPNDRCVIAPHVSE